tara:strand:+ start:627 stop:2285 length:1659 start_codon:yes stop_codon:yes gene_type:complete
VVNTATPDVVVIGSGAGGAAAAWRLCHLGLNVLILEAGPRFEPYKDYTLDQPDWEKRGFPKKEGSNAKITFSDLGDLLPDDDDLKSWDVVSGKKNIGSKRLVSGAGYHHVQGVGGSTLHFVGESHRMHPRAMSLFSDFGKGYDWPISYADLEPYYTVSERVLGVAGPENQGERWRTEPYPLPAHPLSSAAQALVSAGAKIEMEWQQNSRAALSQSYDERPACNYCGNCSKGCPIGDKGSADVTFIRKAEATGRLEIKTGCAVTKLFEGENGHITHLEAIANGTRLKIKTPILVLAAGAVQTPRLLLASAEGGLANSSKQVGQNFMETLLWSSTGILSTLRNSHKGLPADAISWQFNAPDAIPGVLGGCRFNSGVQEIGLNGPISYTTRILDGFGHDLKRSLRQNFGKAITVGSIGEVLPNRNSFVELHKTEVDAFGVPLASIQSVLGATEIARLRFMAQKSRQLLAAAGVTEILEEFSTWDQFSTTHAFGTCRMGNNPTTSVVDKNCRSHDHPNLHITDASVFPSTGGGESPSLTIQALAVLAADNIFNQVQ